MGICDLCAKGSEEINLFKRYENNHKELGPHERNGFISVIFLMLFLFVFNIYDLATGSLYETKVIPVAATPNRNSKSCQKMQSMKENYLQIDATVTAIAGDQNYAPLEENIALTVVSKAGCEVNREPKSKDGKKKDPEEMLSNCWWGLHMQHSGGVKTCPEATGLTLEPKQKRVFKLGLVFGRSVRESLG